eukprot:TRINITY_DN26524_c0_g1_i1.p1 TRINITY_DN26524_c0_g1~~TRINITY_DN26524_c0_g1_i1.p1  ORF type:complete len:547 (-),score=95.88 TRINITY_DN26524_c0_g1_i1:45-1685(-)
MQLPFWRWRRRSAPTLVAFVTGTDLARTAQFSHCGPLGRCYMKCTGMACDSVVPLGTLDDRVAVYNTDFHGDALERRDLEFGNEPPGAWSHWQRFEVNRSVRFQVVKGFGGGFTDAAAANVAKAPPTTREVILDQYFGESGARYSLGRVPMASSDFSQASYTYAPQEDDFDMDNFALTEEDTGLHGKVNLIKAAQNRSRVGIQLCASPWTAPEWLKTDSWREDRLVGGTLTPSAKHQQAWASYYSKFLTAYREMGVDIWAVTVQNQPSEFPRLEEERVESMFLTPEQQAIFVRDFLGPKLSEDHPEVKIIVHDDQKIHLPEDVQEILMDPRTATFVDGIGIQWYLPMPGAGRSNLRRTRNWLVERGLDSIFLLGTEARTGFNAVLSPPHVGPDLGNWHRGLAYASDILGDLNSWAVGWIDANLVLDTRGGPSVRGVKADAPILLDTEDPSVFYKQPTYFVMAHFSHFVPPGSVRIAVTVSGRSPMECVAFETPDDHVVMIVKNGDYDAGRAFYIYYPERGFVVVSMREASIQTIVWKLGLSKKEYV